MRVIHPKEYIAARAWQALDIEQIGETTIRLHWTDQPYEWHINDGPEVFVVLDGVVEMHTRDQSGEKKWILESGDIFHAEAGDAHVAHPQGVARVLVIERAGSI